MSVRSLQRLTSFTISFAFVDMQNIADGVANPVRHKFHNILCFRGYAKHCGRGCKPRHEAEALVTSTLKRTVTIAGFSLLQLSALGFIPGLLSRGFYPGAFIPGLLTCVTRRKLS